MAAREAQIVEPQELIPIADYQFTGDSATVENKCKIVEGYRLKASIYHAAQFAGVHRATVYRYLDNDPQFAQAMADSFEDAADVMETSAYEDALGTPEKAGNALLKMFWLKAHRPKFRDRVAIDIEVVKDEIAQRLSQLGLDRLPLPVDNDHQLASSTITEVIDTDFNSCSGVKHFPHQPEQIQKDQS